MGMVGKMGNRGIFIALMMFFNLEKWRLSASKSLAGRGFFHCRWLLGGLRGLGVLGWDGGEF